MDEQTLRVLEFYKVRDIMAEYAVSAPGRREAAELLPDINPKVVERALRETEELRRMLESRKEFPIRGLKDIATALKKSAIEGAVLRADEFLDILSVARASKLVKAAISASRQVCPILVEDSAQLSTFEPLEFEISQTIGEDGEVLDSASFELKRIRRAIATTKVRINRDLEDIISSPTTAAAVQEPVITIRSDRYVIPLKTNFRTYLQGIVHDHSASGSTVFVEPEKTVEMNNKLATMRSDEKREIERILWQLTASVRLLVEPLTESFVCLVGMDVIYAKAGYALAISAHLPAIPARGIDLRQARHPLLIKTKGVSGAVPLDISIGRDYQTLVITGPNTGGKTVALKTVGLLCIMAQAGMLIPASPDSSLPILSGVYSDIGDEQSLEQNLSTFSSHITQIVKIVKRVSKGSLVLLDELGAGTDPAEGSALGAAILGNLHKSGAWTIVTTHHGALKVFAANTPGAMNASVEFDSESLAPTYRLLVGRPGRSNALVVAARLGMPKDIIDAASKTRGADQVQLDTLIEKLEREMQATQDERRKAALELESARAEKSRLQELVRRAEEDRRDAVQKVKEKANTVLTSLRYKLRELDEMGKRGVDKTEVRKKADEVRVLESVFTETEAAPIESEHSLKIESLKVGDTVRVYKYKKSGKVLSIKKDKNQVVVQLDSMKATLGVNELELANGMAKDVKQASPRKGGNVTLTRIEDEDYMGSAIELNIIGLHMDEAMEKLDRFIDQCLLSGMNEARIVHGRGAGILRRLVSDTLRAHPRVASHEHPPFEQGGDAVTVARFK